MGRSLRILDITGGEPFLCDIPAIIRMLDNGKLRMIFISTNGQLSEKIERDARAILEITESDLFVDISIDGIGKKNEEIRGTEGKYESSLTTIDKLQSLKHKKLRVSWKFTILRENIEQMLDCFNKAHALNIEFTCKPGANYEFLDNSGVNFDLTQDDYEKIIKNLIEISKRRKSRIHLSKASFWDRVFITANNLFNDKLIEYYKLLSAGRKKMIVPCYSTFLSIILHNDSGIYSCPTLMRRLGNIREDTIESIWYSREIRKVRDFINKRKCYCYSQCDQMPAILLSSPHKIILGIIGSYFK